MAKQDTEYEPSGGLLNVPVEECTFTMSEVRIPMPDGPHLAANFYQPSITKPHGLILTIGCYGREGAMAALNGVFFAARGYMVLFASSRGTFGSEGTFVPGMSEQADSQAIVKWMREQSWYPGKFATVGASYLGYTQWALLHDPPEDLVASVILCAPHDQAQHVWANGAYRMDRIMWSYMVAIQEEKEHGQPAASRLAAAVGEVRSVSKALPIRDAVENLLNGRAPYVGKFMATPDIDDPYWNPVRHSAALDRVKTPVLLGSGWYDTFPYQSFHQYQCLKARGCNVGITVGPWTHVPACGMNLMPEALNFLDEHLAGRKIDHRPFPVKIFVTGAEEWRNLRTWPPTTAPRTWYLDSDRNVTTKPPAADSPAASFSFDPVHPTPTIGGPLMVNGGYVDDSAYASRSDLLVYTSPQLEDEVEVMGKPIVQLSHSADVPYADLWVRLSEVGADGVSHNVVETYQALDIERNGDLISLPLQDCAHIFKKGTRIRVIVAGGSFPLMARNPGVEGNRTMTTEMKAVTHTIQHRDGASKLILPCSP